MNLRMARMFRAWGVMALLLGVPLAANAQNTKPLVVVSINKLKEIMDDLGGLAEAAGQQDQAGFVLGLAGLYTSGIDRTRPAGAVVTMGEAGPKVLAFVPVTNLKSLLQIYRDQIGTPRELENGVLEVGADRPQPIYIKEKEGWAFVAQDPKSLADVPADPLKLLQGLDQKYDLAVQLNVSSIPPAVRDLFLSQVKVGYDQSMQLQSRNLPPDQRELADQIGRSLLKGLEDFVEQADQLTVGLAIDGKSRSTSVETTLTALPGTELAKQMAAAYGSKSAFAGLGGKSPAASGNITMALASTDIQQLGGLVKVLRDTALKAIDDDSGVPAEKRETLKKSVGSILDVLQATITAGKIDLAAAVNLGEGGAEFSLGTLLADGAKFEKAVKDLVALGRGEPNFPEVQLDIAKHGGVNLHKVVVPLGGDANARRIFGGDNLEVVLGFGADRMLLTVGRDGMGAMKKLVDQGHTNATDALPLQAQISVGQWARFASRIDASNPQTLTVAAASQKVTSSDVISLVVKPIDRGLAYRYEVAAGVIELIGAVSKAQRGGR
ncbi:MAG: hypothetical protein U0935_23425 [Pirellulales bacterium]